jgi:hypothetical protein
MSEYLSARPHSLSYEAREIACHAIETYSERLCFGHYDKLKVCICVELDFRYFAAPEGIVKTCQAHKCILVVSNGVGN